MHLCIRAPSSRAVVRYLYTAKGTLSVILNSSSIPVASYRVDSAAACALQVLKHIYSSGEIVAPATPAATVIPPAPPVPQNSGKLLDSPPISSTPSTVPAASLPEGGAVANWKVALEELMSDSNTLRLLDILLNLLDRYASLFVDLLLESVSLPSLPFPLVAFCLNAGLPRQSILDTLKVWGKKTKKNSLATGPNEYNRKQAVAQKWRKRLHNGVRYQVLQQSFLTSATTWYEIRFIC